MMTIGVASATMLREHRPTRLQPLPASSLRRMTAGLDVPWLRLRYEDLFDSDGLERLVDFLELPHRAGLFSHRTALVDNDRFLTNVWQDWQIIDNHPRVTAITQRLGYNLGGIEETALRRRYLASPGVTDEGFLTPVRFNATVDSTLPSRTDHPVR